LESKLTKIAYSIFEYENPERVARLASRVQTKSDFVRIHLDPIIGKKKFGEWKKIIEKKCQQGDMRIVSEFRCKYGSFGLVDANLSAMRDYEDYDYDYFIDLSGDSYPLKSPEVIKKELGEKNCARMEFFKLPYKGWYQGGLHRLNYSYYFLPMKKYPYVWTFRLPRIRKGLPCGLKPYGGRGSRCLQKKHVSYILQFTEENPIVKKFFRRVWGPSELFYPTILLNSPLSSTVINQSVLYFDFSERASHPKTLKKSDLETLKRSGKLFARKFNPNVDKDVLDSIDQMLLEY
jgi:hypothetical protein